MSSRIIRGDDRIRKSDIRSIAFDVERNAALEHEELLRITQQQAYEKGFLDGDRVGRQAGELMVQTTASRYERAIAELIHAHEALQRSMETQTVELALEIARKVIQREVSTDPDLVSALALVALKRVQSHHAITLRVSRYDFARIHDAVTAVNGAVSIVEDSSLERGDFMMDTGSTHLDARLQTQVENLGRAMLAEQ
jgi:flagellar assembly protein FliH